MRFQKTQRMALVPALIAAAILAAGSAQAQKAPPIPADLTKAASTGQLNANKTNAQIQDELMQAGFTLEQMNAAMRELSIQNDAAQQKAAQSNTPAASSSNASANGGNQQSGTNVSLPPETSASGSIVVKNNCPSAASFNVSLSPPSASSWISVPPSVLSSGLNVGAMGSTSFPYQVSSNGMNPGSQIAGSIVVKCLNCTNCTQTGTNTFTITLNVTQDTSSPGGGGGGSPPPGGGGNPPPGGGGGQPSSPPGTSSAPGGSPTGSGGGPNTGGPGTSGPGTGGPNTGGPGTTSGPTSSFPQTGPGTTSGPGGTNTGNSGGPTTTSGGSNPTSGGGPTTTGGGDNPTGGTTTVTGTAPTPTTTSTTNTTPTPTTTTGTPGFWSRLMGALTLALGGVGLLTGSGNVPRTVDKSAPVPRDMRPIPGPMTTDTPATTTTGGGTPTTQTTPAPQPTGSWGASGTAPLAATTDKAGGAPTGSPTTVGKDPTPTTPGQTTPTTQTGSTPQSGDWGVTGSGPTPATGGLATTPGNTPQTVGKGPTPTTTGQPTSNTPQTQSTPQQGDWGVTGSGPVPATGGLATAPGNTPQTVSKDPTPTTTGQPTGTTPQTTSTPPAGAWGVAGTGPVAATGDKAGGPGQTVTRDGGNTPGTTEKTGGGTPPTTSKDGDGTWGATGTGPTGGTQGKPAPGPGQTIAKDPVTPVTPPPKPGDRNASGGQTFSKGTTQADLDEANRPPTDDELKAAKPGDGPDEYATREKKLRLGMGMITINNESAPPIVARTDLPRTIVKPKPFIPTTQEDKDRLNYINTKLNDAITKAKSATDLATKAKNLKLARFWLYVRDHYGTLSKDFKNMLDDLQKTEGTYMYPEHEMLLQKYADEGAESVNQYLRDSAEMEFYKGVGAIVDMGGNLGLGATFSAIESELAALSNEAQTGRSGSSSRATTEEEPAPRATTEEEPTPAQHVEDDSNLPDFEKAPVDEEGGWGTRQNWNFEDDSPSVLTDPKTGEAIPATVDPQTGALKPVGGEQSGPATTWGNRSVSPDTPTQALPDPNKTAPDLIGGDYSPAKGMQKTAYEDFSKVPVDPNEAPGTKLPSPNFSNPPPNKQMSKDFIKFHGNIQENPSDPGINPATGEEFFEK
jgi:hypothetical protein